MCFHTFISNQKGITEKSTDIFSFCDIAKAYDSVNGELLNLKLAALGFGGRVKALTRAIYYNDHVRVRLAGGQSKPLWFT